MRRPQRYNARRNYASRSRRKRNWIPLIVITIVFGFFFWAVYQFFSMLFSSVQTEILTTNLNILKGRTEFQLSENESQWTPVFSHQPFFEGDALKTSKKSKSELNIEQKEILILNEKTEIKIEKLQKNSNHQNLSEINLISGEIWSAGLEVKENKSPVNIVTPHLFINGDNASVFNVKIIPQSEIISVIKGSVEISFENSEKKLNVRTGQKIVVPNNTEFLTENDLEPIDIEFINTDWYISNLEKTNPEKAQKLLNKKEEETQKNSENIEHSTQDKNPGLSDIESPKILEPAPNTVIPANPPNPIKLSGTAPLEAFQIEVNGFALSKFQAGDRKWTYYLSPKFKTLKPGLNTYSIVTVDRMGKKSKPAKIEITYNGTAPNFTLPKVGERQDLEFSESVKPKTEKISLNKTFNAPLITRPAFFKDNPNGVYQTAASIITFAGIVPPLTKFVKINGFKLKKFKEGDTKFSYIANANYGNMKEGQNTYTIIAFGPNEIYSKTKIIIEYTPIKL